MPSLGDLFGEGTTARQFMVWNVLSQLVGAAINPFLLEIQQLENMAFPNVPLSPDMAAAAVARHLLSMGDANSESIKSGVDTDVLATMVKLARRGPDMSSVMEAYRRGIIDTGSPDPDEVSVLGALTDMGIKSEWHSTLVKLSKQVPTVAEVMNAWLEGQITEGEAHKRYLEAGGDPTWFQTSYDANGQAPTPVQALELLNRGIIPQSGTGPGATSYEQAFLEGPWRNKWLPAFLALREYLPPPRTVTAMYREGSIGHDQAARWLAQQGLAPATIALYLKPKEKTATTTEKHLAKGDILALYKDRVLTKAKAHAALTGLGYTGHDADELLSLTDVRAQIANTNSATTRIRTLFIGGKIARADALATLVKLGVTRTDATELLSVWELESSKEVRHLSPAQVESAAYYKFITDDEALDRLVVMGYTRHDAWLALSVRYKGKVKPEPPRDS